MFICNHLNMKVGILCLFVTIFHIHSHLIKATNPHVKHSSIKTYAQTESDSPENVSPFNLDSLADNWDELNQLARNIHECSKYIRPSNYLIITTPQHYHFVKKYAEWKKMLGHGVKIITNKQWTQSLIRSTISSNYQTDSTLFYVLFAGSISEIPAYDKNSSIKNFSDFPYAVLDNIEERPGYERSVFTGRLLVDEPSQMPTILNKLKAFILWGLTPPIFISEQLTLRFLTALVTLKIRPI